MINLSIHHFRIDLLFIGIDDIDMKIRSNNNKLISHFEMLAPDSLTLSRAYDILIAISINMYSVWFETINTCNDGSIFGASNFSRCFSFMALECRQKKKISIKNAVEFFKHRICCCCVLIEINEYHNEI